MATKRQVVVKITPYKAWRARCRVRACREGWDMFACPDGFLRLEKDDEKDIFTDDEQAVRFVLKQALAGSRMHLLALYLDGRPADVATELLRALVEAPKTRQ